MKIKNILIRKIVKLIIDETEGADIENSTPAYAVEVLSEAIKSVEKKAMLTPLQLYFSEDVHITEAEKSKILANKEQQNEIIDELTRMIVEFSIEKDLTHYQTVCAVNRCEARILGMRLAGKRSSDKLKEVINPSYFSCSDSLSVDS
ncbi:hypothetical protein LJB89_02310 [Tyzzerella sp. OttesenSCG-928-J15]|nr:hypothetical protein [Tyzzerella sp. OttesenSCG-928-J15]